MISPHVDHVTPALADQLTDIRCAIRDGMLDYATDCTDRAIALTNLLLTGNDATYRQVADILNR